MLKLRDIIDEVKHFEFESENLYYSSGRSLRERTVFYVGTNKELALTPPNKVFSIKYGAISQQTWINNKDKSELYSNGVLLKEFADLIFVDEVSDNLIIANLKGIDNFVLWDIKNSCIVTELPFSSTIFKVNFPFIFIVIFNEVLERNKLVCFDLINQLEKWQIDFKQNNELSDKQIDKIILSSKGTVWLALTGHSLIEIDTSDGNIIRHLNKIKGFESDWLPSSIPEPKATMFNDIRSELIGLMFEFFWQIKGDSGAIEFHDLTEYFREKKIRNDNPNFILLGDIIVFISRHESKIGAFNTRTKQIDWTYDFEKKPKEEMPEFIEIKGNDKVLGALDRSNKLHVFEMIKRK